MQENQAQVLGDTDVYEIAPDIKKYSLMDAGFVEGRNDHFKLSRPISGTSPYDARYLLKITISDEFKRLRMAITDKSGLHNLNIYKGKDTKDEIDDYKFMMNFLEQKDILIKK
ncbi:hypothetical protein [Companilactobacillus sp.]|jgi:hypothetical protein|uniref:hypothetical protein n=1 Tax=Companilactobacillus sp. TaxID=2767905 RepID=UPI0025C0D77F|nr:hypothetical protein [Companilactobacillus sp.]MCH4008432.1 DUF1831 domain-containing protein [Companilactobacillus sp.]MCH4051389.1 DUF1831 domain-containing protein [Companilactobacillus sp.]MCH4076375.1 DUF1831 domain-containing protein [Companilactobacillus sp.]MCH4124950.1 DUF1831 domain-containing protein [Companilactobacillus sp.]MCH4131492.1 DUF1831 domain-containing protein [Companilactobacillus sp.]